MWRWRRPSLYTRIALSLTAALAMSFAFAAALSVNAGRRTLERHAREDLESGGRLVRRDIARFLAQRSGDIKLCADLEAMDDLLISDPALRIQNQLQRLDRTFPGSFQELLALNENGAVVASTRLTRMGGTLDITSLNLQPRADGSLQSWGAVVVPGAAGPGVLIARPIRSRSSTERFGWLVGLIDWRAIEGLVAAVDVAGLPQRDAGFVLLLDPAGRIIARPASITPRLLGEAGAAAAQCPPGTSIVRLGPEGTYIVACDTPVSPKNSDSWRVIMFRDTNEAFAVVRVFVSSVLVAALIGLLVATLVAIG